MNLSLKNPRLKLYLTMGITMAVIFTIWIVTLVHTLSSQTPASQNNNIPTTNESLEPLKEKFSQLFTELKVLKSSLLNQAATSTGDTIQGALQIKPEDLNEIVEKLVIATSTPTTTPATSTKVLK
ncbi:MAG TPA: hypothetical protein P5267_00710 [Patescibacteria group bacterium]|nr:hypothetical protein [Patescibacteria group bacterium]